MYSVNFRSFEMETTAWGSTSKQIQEQKEESGVLSRVWFDQMQNENPASLVLIFDWRDAANVGWTNCEEALTVEYSKIRWG